jgi:transposase
MRTYSGIDLHSHSSNNYVGVIDDKHQRLYRKRLPNRLDTVLAALKPFKDSLEGVVVESTFNWYWLVDGLKEHGYKVHLANSSLKNPAFCFI